MIPCSSAHWCGSFSRLEAFGLQLPLTRSKFPQRSPKGILPFRFLVCLQRPPDRFRPLGPVLAVGRLQEHRTFLRVQSKDKRFLLLDPVRLNGHDVAEEDPAERLQAFLGLKLSLEVAERLVGEDEVASSPTLDDPTFLEKKAFLQDQA